MYKYYKLEDNRSPRECDEMRMALISDAKTLWKEQDEFSYRNCPICDSDDFEEIDKFNDSFKVSLCINCNSQYVNPVPSNKLLKKFYNDGKFSKLMNKIYSKRVKKEKSFIVDVRVEKLYNYAITKNKKFIKILEIGCNRGEFIERVLNFFSDKEIDIEIHGIDLDEDAVKEARCKGLNVINISAEELVNKKEWKEYFDIVCHFELIEHLVDPSTFVKACQNTMKKNSIMFFTTPNLEGLEVMASSYNSRRLMWHAIMPPAHLNAFSILNITTFALQNKLSVVSIETPGKLDVDCITIYDKSNDLSDPIFSKISSLNEEYRAWLQNLIIKLRASGSMAVILQKNY